ncbi:MAG: hypothetical protein M1480_08170 [Bacteroidetes bacterium]|nr:hypothetical protein [Bacteroidota bacterium]
MNNKFINTYQAHKRINDLFDEKKEVVDSIPAFRRYADIFSANLKAIEQKESGHKDLTEGKTDVKAEARHDLIAAIVKVADAENNYASENNLVELEAKSNLTESTLRNMRDTQLGEKAKAVLDLSAGIEAGLIDHGLKAEKLEAAKACLTAYNGSITSRDLGENLSVAVTKSVAQLMSEDSSIVLDRFRRYVGNLEDEQPEFCARYHVAKRVINLGGGHKGNDGGGDNPPPDTPTDPA